MEKGKKELDKKLDCMIAEYNKLVDYYNQLLNKAKALAERNYILAKEVIEERQRNR